MTRHAESLARSIGHLDWFKIPHTLDQVVGIYAEATAELAGTTSRSRSNSEMVEAIRAQSLAGGHGKGGHSDPTPAAALRGQPDAVDDDETMGMIDASSQTSPKPQTRSTTWSQTCSAGPGGTRPPRPATVKGWSPTQRRACTTCRRGCLSLSTGWTGTRCATPTRICW